MLTHLNFFDLCFSALLVGAVVLLALRLMRLEQASDKMEADLADLASAVNEQRVVRAEKKLHPASPLVGDTSDDLPTEADDSVDEQTQPVELSDELSDEPQDELDEAILDVDITSNDEHPEKMGTSVLTEDEEEEGPP